MEKSAQKRRTGNIGKRRASSRQPVRLSGEQLGPNGNFPSSSAFKGARMKYSTAFKWTAVSVVIAVCE